MNKKPFLKLALIAATILTAALVPNTCDAAYYDLQYNNYIYYNGLANDNYAYYGYWSWSYMYYGMAVPYFNYFLAGYYGDLYGYYDWNGYKQYGAGPYWWQYYTSVGDWWWNNY
jgi:hypothetical protein